MFSSASLRQRVITAAIMGLLVASSAIQAQSLGGNSSERGNAKVNYSVFADGRNYDEFIVHYNKLDSRSTNSRAAYAHLDAVANSTGRTLEAVRDIAAGGLLIKADRELNSKEMAKLMEALAADPGVDFVEPNAIMLPLLTPNDSRFGEQWHYTSIAAGLNATSAWDVATGTGIRVAVLDTGITSHPDLDGNVIAGYDFVSNSTNARDGNGRDSNPADQGDWSAAGECYSGSPAGNSSWHGTHVAGTIAAVTNNASGVAGVAYNSRIVPVRVLAKCGGSLADIADAITWSSGGTVSGISNIAAAAQVINMSLGGSGSCGTTYQNAINGAVGRGTIVIVAAGNSNTNASSATPANCANVVTVASTGRTGARAYYSNYGAVVDLAAPGGDVSAGNANGVLSTLNAGTTTPGAASYAFYQGTSMAAPHAAGVAALVLSKCSKTPAQLETLLKAAVDPFPGTCSQCGTGLLDARKAVDACGGTTPPPVTNVLTNGVPVTGLSAATGTQLAYTIVVPAGASNLNIVTSGGSGDADLHVKFGSAATISSYDCRPYLGGNAETCSFAAPQAGTYHVMVNAYAAFSGLTLSGAYTAGSGGGGGGQSFFENLTDYTISDNATVESPISVTGRTGNAPSTLRVSVTILHTYQGDLKVDLVAPDGSLYNIHNRSGAGTDNIIKTVTVNASTEVANGTWKLRVNDNANGDVGRIDKWSLQF